MSGSRDRRFTAPRGGNRATGRAASRPARLDTMIAEATVDCYNESEAATGFFTMIEENLALPFEAQILGDRVTVEGIDITGWGEIVAICSRNGFRQPIPLRDLPLPRPAPEGAEWIAAYRRWRV
jgi:hypothetical protein